MKIKKFKKRKSKDDKVFNKDLYLFITFIYDKILLIYIVFAKKIKGYYVNNLNYTNIMRSFTKMLLIIVN